ncbi:MAG TPA: TlpA disulfide reductase family protein [Armatimonadota bacterium]|nr:TlpA disulfide reductase family protein [Armatimonadota bacterium]
MRYWKPVLLAAVAAVSLGLTAPHGGQALAAPAKVTRGQLPPDFTGATLDGRKITLSQFRGKNPVVLNFFAEFCGPCKKEFPHLKALDEQFGARGLKVIAVSLDEDRQTAAMVPNQSRVRFPVVFDPKAGIAEKYGVQAIPHTVILDREGKVHTVLIGLDLEKLDEAVAQVMK